MKVIIMHITCYTVRFANLTALLTADISVILFVVVRGFAVPIVMMIK